MGDLADDQDAAKLRSSLKPVVGTRTLSIESSSKNSIANNGTGIVDTPSFTERVIEERLVEEVTAPPPDPEPPAPVRSPSAKPKPKAKERRTPKRLLQFS